MEYLFLAVLWATWCIVHSAMISLRFTALMENRLGDRYRYYRIIYNLVALFTFIPLLFYTKAIDGTVLLQWQGVGVVFQVALLLTSIFLFAAGGRKYDGLQVLGIRQARSGKSHLALSAGGGIDTEGILSVTRHPWYLAALLFIWSWHSEMTLAILLHTIILTIYLFVGTMLEEKKLIHEFGDEYRHYKSRVSMLLPFKWLYHRIRHIL